MNTLRVRERPINKAWRVVGSMGLFLVAAALPKCPLCIVVYLSAFGVSATVATLLAPWLLPLVWTAAVSVGVYVGVRLVRSRAPTTQIRPSETARDERCCNQRIRCGAALTANQRTGAGTKKRRRPLADWRECQ